MDGPSSTWIPGTSSPGSTMLGIPGCIRLGGSSNEIVGTAGFVSGGGLKMMGTFAAAASQLAVDRLRSRSSLGPRETGLVGMTSSAGAAKEICGAGSGAARTGRGEAARIIS